MFFYLMDAGIVIATIFLGNYFLEFFNLSPVMNLISFFFLAILGVWLCLRTGSHPVDRNLYMVMHLLRSDKNRYHDISITEYENKYKVKKSEG